MHLNYLHKPSCICHICINTYITIELGPYKRNPLYLRKKYKLNTYKLNSINALLAISFAAMANSY